MKNPCSAFLILLLAAGAQAQESDSTEQPGGGDSDLARATQNPVGDLISVPFQNNMSFNVGADDRVLNVMNIQPVYPVSIGENWNLITRTILPVVSSPVPGMNRTDGIGDLSFTGFISPKKPGKVIWGAGPVAIFPTASDDLLGSDTYSLGPSVVVLSMPGNWVVGGLVSQWWDVSGDENISQFLFQPIINYNFTSGWYFTSAPIMTANWEAESGDRWTVPIGGGFGKIVRVGKLPININSQIFYNVEKPEGAADWTWRFQVQLIFPK
jgi:hypothetical protein